MDRKDFIKSCGMACLGGIGAVAVLQSCTGSKIVSGSINDSDLIIATDDFIIRNIKEVKYKSYVVVQNDLLKFPICVYRLGENDYKALYMECSHQGAELQVFGSKLQCPAHGSEFTNSGAVSNGPADKALRTFPVTITNDQLKISLK